jgi:hypothetical protein
MRKDMATLCLAGVGVIYLVLYIIKLYSVA